ncbi:peptide deformylase [Chengkuizengella marina]|uniref:Peptide deformylase n=1 Tax=Chengkuizengella marina TaxID=2507566 RepID=A0A6N9Q482_9BACL|nr:peptide deformylase [Chengkuizengella marina]NBI29612.1 peptide deformylase [Chengkuizengella marina]
MAIRVIVKNPDPILREKCKQVTKFNKNLHKLLDDMAETMYDAPGVGLAAPQIGILKRVIVLDSGEEDGPGLIELVNPEIIKTSTEKEIGPEGCLSIPSISGDVNRFKAITVKGLDRNGNEVEYEAEDFLARIFQHEIDHLNGILFTDIAETIYEGEQPNNVID